jgi:BirA family biotin operon repressor/biotin-[acetyl-CoA-carboxylase] ligase
VEELARFGFGLEWHPYRGVAYRSPAPRLCPDQIEWGLSPKRIGRRIAVWSRVASTNDLAAAAASSPANEGLVIMAEEQTAGRGRLGRLWQAPRGSSILMSVLLFPPPVLDVPRVLTALGAVAVAELVESLLGRPAAIKWPNDVRIGGRKLAGILVERGAGCVVGIGLNANLGREELPPPLSQTATSLSREAGCPVDRSEVARELIGRLDRLYDAALADGGAALDAAWAARLEGVGGRVRVETPEGPVLGRLEGASLVRGMRLSDDTGRSLVVAPEAVLDLRTEGGEAAAAAGEPPAGANSALSSLSKSGVDC